MNEVVVGVKRVAGLQLEDDEHEAVTAIGAVWVTIDGKELPCKRDDSNLISVTTRMDHGPMFVTLEIVAASIKTVSFDDPDEAPERHKRKVSDV